MRPPPLIPGAAVGALMVAPDGRYLLQHRDDRPEIFFPGAWGMFGGGIEPGETPEEALRRELAEELSISGACAEYFCTLEIDFRFAGAGRCPRHFFVLPTSEAEIGEMRLGEGQGMALFDGATVAAMPNVVPYDALAIWQHRERARFRGRVDA